MTVVSLDTHRAAKIGGSEAAAACGVDPFRSRLMLWAEKTGRIERDETEAMRWGKLLEPVVFQELERRGFQVFPAPAVEWMHAANTWMVGHPDGFVDIDGARGVLEVKTAGQWSGAHWTDDAGAPLAYLVQVHHYMTLTGLDVALLACLIGGQRLELRHVTADDVVTAQMMQREAELIDFIRTDTPPPPMGLDSDRDAIKAMHGASDGSTIRLDKATMQLVREARELHEQRDTIDRQYKEHVQKIQLAMGDAEHAISPFDTPAASWPTVKRTALDTKSLKTARPDVWGEFAVTTSTRRFTLG